LLFSGHISPPTPVKCLTVRLWKKPTIFAKLEAVDTGRNELWGLRLRINERDQSSRVATRVFVGLSPQTKLQNPTNENMKHCKSVEFYYYENVPVLLHKRKDPHWKLSGDGSGLERIASCNQRFYILPPTVTQLNNTKRLTNLLALQKRNKTNSNFPRRKVSFRIAAWLLFTFSKNVPNIIWVERCKAVVPYLHELLTYRVFHNCWNRAAASKTFIDDLIHFSLSRLS